MPNEGESYYVRVRGKISGPFDHPALERMVHRGQLSRAHEVSIDKQNWKPATSVAGLFAVTARKTPGYAPSSSGGADSPPLVPGQIATPNIQDDSTFQCSSCGAVFLAAESIRLGEQQLCAKCHERIAGPAPAQPSAAEGTKWMDILTKARQEQSEPTEETSAQSDEEYQLVDDGRPKVEPQQPLVIGLLALLKNPAYGIAGAYQKLGIQGSIKVGLIGVVIFEASLPLSMRYSLLDIVRFVYSFNGEALHQVPALPSAVITAWVKLVVVMTAPFLVLATAMFITRTICRPGTALAGDILTAGVGLAPFTLVCLAIAILGNNSCDVAVALGLFAGCLLVLILFHGLKDIAGLAPRWATLVTPTVLLAAILVTKVLILLLFL
jgi:GYF domain 2